MDKEDRLRRYQRKDYTEVVDFPVEIVGRDGSVRRYDFEESVRLYQRRMGFAAVRFRDEELISAEQGHCRSRVEQLRRSYFHLHGWTPVVGRDGPEASRVDLAGEIAGFLLRVFRESGRLAVRFTAVSKDGPGELWFVERDGAPGGLLLYTWTFEGPTSELGQAAFADILRDLRGSEANPGDAERLVGYHRCDDCAFVLTGRAHDVVGLAAAAPEDDGADLEPSPWEEAVDLVRRGDLPSAFLRCRSIVEAQPWHRDAYALGASLAVLLRRPGDAEDLAFVGTRYYPSDPLLQHTLGLSRLHQGRSADAIQALQDAVSKAPGLTAARSLLVLAHLERMSALAAFRVLRLPRGLAVGADETSHRRLVKLLSLAALFALFTVVTLAGNAVGMGLVGRVAAFPLVAALVMAVVGTLWFRARLEELRGRHLFEDPERALERVRRTRA